MPDGKRLMHIAFPLIKIVICSPGRSSDFRINLLTASSRISRSSDIPAAFVPDYSGGPVSDFHGIPY